MPTNGSSHPDPGLRLVLEELRDFRREAALDRKETAKDRKQAAEDRKQAAEDRLGAAVDRKEIRLALGRMTGQHHRDLTVVAGAVADVAKLIGGLGRKMDASLGLLVEIRDQLKRAGRNGHAGNGHGKSR